MLYLLRFSKPLGNARHQARFYLGYCKDDPKHLAWRVSQHRRGVGARITAAAVKAGATLDVVWTGAGDRKDERRLKARRHHHRLIQSSGEDIQP